MSASPTTGARDLPVNRGIYNFDRLRIEFYGDRQAAFEAFKKGEIHLPPGGDLATLGDGLRFPGDHRPARSSSASSRPKSARPCRRSPSTSGASAFATCACAGRSRCASTSNGRTHPCSTGSTSARSPASRSRSSRRSASPARTNWRCSSRCATGCRPRCSARPVRCRRPTGAGATGSCSARRAS